MKVRKRIIVLALFIAGVSPFAHSQSLYKLTDSKSRDMKLSGTSTLHDWTMSTRTFIGEAQFGFAPGNSAQLISVSALSFSLAVLDLKSDEKGLDKNAYKALKTNDYKDITYQLLSSIVRNEQGSKYSIKTQGKLSIAGVTHVISMDVKCEVNPDATITCTGSDQLKMTDYQVKPPSFMLGVMTTGDMVTLDFTLVYKKQTGI